MSSIFEQLASSSSIDIEKRTVKQFGLMPALNVKVFSKMEDLTAESLTLDVSERDALNDIIKSGGRIVADISVDIEEMQEMFDAFPPTNSANDIDGVLAWICDAQSNTIPGVRIVQNRDSGHHFIIVSKDSPSFDAEALSIAEEVVRGLAHFATSYEAKDIIRLGKYPMVPLMGEEINAEKVQNVLEEGKRRLKEVFGK